MFKLSSILDYEYAFVRKFIKKIDRSTLIISIIFKPLKYYTNIAMMMDLMN